jgi:hypothetical protein
VDIGEAIDRCRRKSPSKDFMKDYRVF